mmetsp:Transcript_23303/g.59572  ORF Transcript_23303/g.59572 Transcript_23303/m.59572 type:complete len:217 (+) Transcript_23303:746-1396(+)
MCLLSLRVVTLQMASRNALSLITKSGHLCPSLVSMVKPGRPEAHVSACPSAQQRAHAHAHPPHTTRTLHSSIWRQANTESLPTHQASTLAWSPHSHPTAAHHTSTRKSHPHLSLTAAHPMSYCPCGGSRHSDTSSLHRQRDPMMLPAREHHLSSLLRGDTGPQLPQQPPRPRHSALCRLPPVAALAVHAPVLGAVHVLAHVGVDGGDGVRPHVLGR